MLGVVRAYENMEFLYLNRVLAPSPNYYITDILHVIFIKNN